MKQILALFGNQYLGQGQRTTFCGSSCNPVKAGMPYLIMGSGCLASSMTPPSLCSQFIFVLCLCCFCSSTSLYNLNLIQSH